MTIGTMSIKIKVNSKKQIHYFGAQMADTKLENFRIPAMPQIAREALNYFYKSDPDVSVIARIIHSDVALTGTVLKLGNSSRFNTNGPKTSDLKIAIGRIGLNALRQILVTHAFSQAFNLDAKCPLDATAFWRHSAFTAEIAFELSQKSHRNMAADLQLSGVMHDIGFLLFAMNDPEHCAQVIDKCARTGNDFCTTEINMGLTPHHEYSAAIVRAWNIPQTVEILVAHHDIDDSDMLSKLSPEIRVNIAILQISDILSHRFGGTYKNYHRETRLDPKLLTMTGLVSDDIARAVKNAKSFLEVFIPT